MRPRLEIPELADLLGERHRIIANDWQASGMSALAGRVLVRAADMLEQVDFSPAPLRADLAASALRPRLLYSAAELIDHAADLLSDSAGLVHDNGRRWRVFAEVGELVGNESADGSPDTTVSLTSCPDRRPHGAASSSASARLYSFGISRHSPNGSSTTPNRKCSPGSSISARSSRSAWSDAARARAATPSDGHASHDRNDAPGGDAGTSIEADIT